MAFKDVVNVPITKIDTVIEVISKGDGSHERDQVMVSSNLTLAADIDSAEEATLLLPMASEAQQQPIVRYTDEHVRRGRLQIRPDRPLPQRPRADRAARSPRGRHRQSRAEQSRDSARSLRGGALLGGGSREAGAAEPKDVL